MKTNTVTKPSKIDSLLSQDEIETLNKAIAEIPTEDFRQHPDLGRIEKELYGVPEGFPHKLLKIANDFYKELQHEQTTTSPVEQLQMVWPPLYVEYNAKYGTPALPPHFDGDYNEVIINYQLDSSTGTTWPIGVDLELYTLEDNQAAIFDPNRKAHWRPHRTFQQDEFVRMVFFRFFKSENISDYSYLPNHPDNPVFKEVVAYRNSLKTD